MLPEYTIPQLNMECLTDDIMTSALDQMELLTMPIDVARNACYQWMGHSIVWAKEFAAFERAYRHEIDSYATDTLSVIDALSFKVEALLRAEEEISYRKRLSAADIIAARKKSGIYGDVEILRQLLAALVVSGPVNMKNEWKYTMEQYHLSVADIMQLAKHYSEEEGVS